ncbi:MAG TPA: serine hydrolase domain-containing protein [Acidothermaceae bacterium]|nr:serine hydrolase domain-containing protein [Acidothermaceae bacterium]
MPLPPETALAQVAHWPASNPAAGITDASRTLGETGDLGRRHQWASVTKLVTALCVLRLVDDGEIALDEPAGPPESTVRHLLAHASGLGFDEGAAISKPERRRVYSNAGFDLLGTLISERTGLPFARYVTEAVFGPLGMRASSIEGTPSAGGVGPLVDLLRFARELLLPTLIAPATLALASTVAFPGLDGVLPGYGRCTPNDWGLGFELRDAKDPHWTGQHNSPSTFGHFGRAGSFLWIDPTLDLGCVALADTAFGPWAIAAWPVFSDAVIAQYGDQPVRPVM